MVSSPKIITVTERLTDRRTDRQTEDSPRHNEPTNDRAGNFGSPDPIVVMVRELVQICVTF